MSIINFEQFLLPGMVVRYLMREHKFAVSVLLMLSFLPLSPQSDNLLVICAVSTDYFDLSNCFAASQKQKVIGTATDIFPNFVTTDINIF